MDNPSKMLIMKKLCLNIVKIHLGDYHTLIKGDTIVVTMSCPVREPKRTRPKVIKLRGFFFLTHLVHLKFS